MMKIKHAFACESTVNLSSFIIFLKKWHFNGFEKFLLSSRKLWLLQDVALHIIRSIVCKDLENM